MKKRLNLMCFLISISFILQAINEAPIYQSSLFTIYPNSVVQGNFKAKAISNNELSSNFQEGDLNKLAAREVVNLEDRNNFIWKLSKNISAFPQYKSSLPIADAIYNLSTEEMISAVEPDSTFRTGKLWGGVWTRDISYSIILAMAYLQPKVAQYSLLRKVKNNRIVQDTGTGGSYPVSTDRIVWSIAAWELYKVTGDRNWLKQAFLIIKNSIEDDIKVAYDLQTGLVKGESSFLDWREQTYPRWMQPADIYESETLGTNAIHYQANVVLSNMAKLLNDRVTYIKHKEIAGKIKNGINKYLWIKEKGYYGQFLYGRNFKIVSPRAEALGEALCVWFGIADAKKAKSIVAHVPVMDFGISCIYPQIPGIPPYHNNAVWPFVQSYWALASAKAGNEKSVLESFAAVYRPAALFLTDKENFVANTGDCSGTEINSSNMLWSLSGSLALVHRVLFGIEFGVDSLKFNSFVPEAFAGNRSLTNFKYRKAVLNMQLIGFGNHIERFELDGKLQKSNAIPASLKGKHRVQITLNNSKFIHSTINKVNHYITLETPIVNIENELLKWKIVSGAVSYRILKNGQLLSQTVQNSMSISTSLSGEYQVLAIDSNKVPSFASEPLFVSNNDFKQSIEVEKFAPKSTHKYQNYQGEGFVEISKSENREITIPLDIKTDGVYAISFRYSNGNGDKRLENKCAMRNCLIDGSPKGTVIFPQRGFNEWSDWGNSNSIIENLTKGKHLISIVFNLQNENMNGEVNQAMLDALNVLKIK